MTDAEPTEIEQTVLDRLAEEETSTPATIAFGVEADLGTVYDVIRSLRERGLLERVGFDTCRLTDRGRQRVTTGASDGEDHGDPGE